MPDRMCSGRHAPYALCAAVAALVVSVALLGSSGPRLVSDDEVRPSATATPTWPGGYHATGTVTRVVDGDTIEVSGVAQDVRVLGIDTPEPSNPVECWSEEATAFAQTTVAGQTVDLRTDPTQETFDRFGRLLAYVTLPDGTDYSIAAAAAGAARSAEVFNNTPVLLAAQISAAVAAAQQSDLGLWGPPCNETE